MPNPSNTPRLDPLQIRTHDTYSTLTLSDAHMSDVAAVFEEHGRSADGCAWADVALYILQTDLVQIKDSIQLDPEAGQFVAFSTKRGVLEKLGYALAHAFHTPDVLREYVAQAPWEWD